jgi:SAM-dependent methyltransferase
VGEKDNTHVGSREREDERDRVQRVYAAYRRDPRKRWAWRAENPGNAGMRAEISRAMHGLLGEVSAGEGLVLDAGCGTGWWLADLQRRGVAPQRLVGVDLLAERVAMAQQRVPGARVLQGDLRQLALPDRSCSLVLLFTVLSAMRRSSDVRAALDESRRVLSRGGTIAIWEPRVPTVNRHTRLIGLRELRGALGEELTVRSVTLAPPLARRAGRLYDPLARVALLRTHRLVLARPD